ncbi:glycogen debranching N-terminal domain-containing protein [Phenylobacterium sp.]|uniref:amylo-alpha-1,6-glucosidase n=2 Tax=Phenylobacterium sp. TaxID=1871053 RepID=UPI00356192AB
MQDPALAPQAHFEAAGERERSAPERLFTLKDGDVFLVCDAFGDVHGVADGMFHNDTRLLSRLTLHLDSGPPALLSSAVGRDNVVFTANATNHPLAPLGAVDTPEGVVHLERKRLIWQGRMFEHIRCMNYGQTRATLLLDFRFDADFKDMFEVRGQARAQRGRRHPPAVGRRGVRFEYEGLDGAKRQCVIAFSEAPSRIDANAASIRMELEPGRPKDLYLEIGPEDAPPPSEQRYRQACLLARAAMRRRLRRGGRVRSSARLFNAWLDKSRADLALLTTDLPSGPYPYAGIPWFSTTFGRDAIITAWQLLWLDPGLAKGVLTYLAETQAGEHSSFRDSAPGKILHEARRGEMAAQGEVPFGRYYGGVDTTCLFVALATAYMERTGDRAFLDQIWPALLAATGWMDSFADSDPLGLIRYEREADTGLLNQGWKDSHDSIFHADGRQPEGPIALVEVQGYAYAAYCGMARLAAQRLDRERAESCRRRAEQIRAAVESRFWMPDVGYYGIALDGEGDLCRVKASNAGHLLFVGLPSPDRAQAVMRTLLGSEFANGWGLRTLAGDQPRYNPMSYHNGSVWPHDTALCVIGFRRYGGADAVPRLLSALFEVAVHFDMRLPELFCGFPRRPGEPPVAYPVACLPQAWAAASVFGILQACLGLQVDGWRQELHVRSPRLPWGISELRLENLPISGRRLDLVFRDAGGRVMVLPGRNEEQGVPLITHT